MSPSGVEIVNVCPGNCQPSKTSPFIAMSICVERRQGTWRHNLANTDALPKIIHTRAQIVSGQSRHCNPSILNCRKPRMETSGQLR